MKAFICDGCGVTINPNDKTVIHGKVTITRYFPDSVAKMSFQDRESEKFDYCKKCIGDAKKTMKRRKEK